MSEDLELPTLAERYVLESAIAKGGMATVYRAQDRVLARAVAVKVLHSHLADDPGFLERFRLEALAAARLTHPNIVAIYDTGTQRAGGPEAPEQHFIVMEHCGRGSLRDLLRAEGSLPAERAVRIGTTIADALSYAHAEEIVHRDVKPANVLVADDGSLKVGDFGIAKAALGSADLTTSGEILGTVTYLAPEQIDGREPDARSDIYSLGIVLYELLTGRPPFVGETHIATAMMHKQQAPPAPRSLRAGIPRPLEETVLRALAKDPADRFATAGEMRSELEAQISGGVPTVGLPVTGAAPPDVALPADENAAEVVTRRVGPVLALIAGAVIVSLALAALLAEPDGGSGGGRNGGSAGGLERVTVASGDDFDPHGGDGEHPEDVPLAFDDDEATAWTTSTYEDPLSLIGKPGVGIVFDLGDDADVSRIEIVGSGGYSLEMRSGDELGADETSLEVFATVDGAATEETVELEETVDDRYWLLWITQLSADGAGRAEIREVRFFGP
ncbi:MAG: protein kinase domain-containing protein [Actinomycetota bacterium]